MAGAKYVTSFLGGSATEVAEGKEPGGWILRDRSADGHLWNKTEEQEMLLLI